MKKKITTATTLFGGLSLGLFAYSHLVEQRSLRSFAIEKGLALMMLPNRLKKQPQAMAQLLNKAEKINQRPVKNPQKLIASPVTEFYFEGMQVFSWNDLDDPQQKVIFYFHGGAYISQPSAFHYRAVEEIAKQTGARVIYPIYPKIPAANFKTVFPLIEDLYREVLLSVYSGEQITLMGDSAGGGLALGLALALKQRSLPQPKDIILLSPWLDIDTRNPVTERFQAVDPLLSAEQLFLLGKIWADDDLKNPLVSPLLGNFSGLGKITIFVGNREIFYPSALVLERKLTEAQQAHQLIIADKMNHGYVIFPTPEGKQARKKIAEIILLPR